MYFFSPAERERKELFGGVNARTFWGEHMLLAVVDIPANGVIPPHSHPHEQAGMVVAGELTFTVDGETRTLRAGDVYVIPGGVEHSVVAGDAPAQALDVFSPVREEYKY
ncbi:MAG: cupin domain-containing protein [Chloroflexota bacterium]|nr:cupin domain-containing protein [Chloroflexota bacterium]